MGLFDTIERLNTADERPASPKPPATATTTSTAPAQDYHQATAEDDGPDTWRPSPAEIEERRRILSRKPERLSFLAPCPVCHGRAFLHIDGGGFVCRSCTPGLFGYPVEATGQEEQQGQPHDIDLHTAGDHADTEATTPCSTHAITEEQRKIFAASWPWIKENKAALLAAGWTMAALVRRARYRWPYGPWGVAWLPVWHRPGLVVEIGRRGGIAFTFPSSGLIITQTDYPTPKTNTHCTESLTCNKKSCALTYW